MESAKWKIVIWPIIWCARPGRGQGGAASVGARVTPKGSAERLASLALTQPLSPVASYHASLHMDRNIMGTV
jgi:hypothetical protein